MSVDYLAAMQKLKNQQHTLRSQGVAETDLPFLLHRPGQTIGILLLHGSAASPCNHLELGRALFDRGFTVLAGLLAGHHDLNLLYSGKTTWEDCYQSAWQDLKTLQALTQVQYIVGSSFGGTLAYIMGIEGPQEIAGIIALSAPTLGSRRPGPFSPWVTQIEAAIATVEKHIQYLTLPTLVMHGVDDRHVKSEHALFAFQTMSAVQKKLVFYQGIGHALGFGYNTPEVAEDIIQFLLYYHRPLEVTFILPDQAYQKVELVGVFNHWQAGATPMEKDEDHWRIQISLPRGKHHYKFLVNQAHWILDPRAPFELTPHGDRNSIIYVD